MQAKKKTLPFSVSRNDSRTLFAQVSDGLREAIVSGYYAPGDVLPTSRELARLLGVSMIVAAPALKRLADEGLVEARPRRGTIVRDRAAKQWRGHVIFVYPESDIDYFPSVFAERLRIRLNRAGYLFTRATVARATAGGAYDFALLDAALSRSVDLTIVFDNRSAIYRHLAARGVPFAAVAHTATAPAGAVGFTRFDYESAVPQFVAACMGAGVRKALVLRWDSMMCDPAPALEAAGIAVSTISVKPDFSKGKHMGVEEAGFRSFSKLLAAGRLNRDVACFISDDYIARGALSALHAAGCRAPENVRLAIWANAGIGPWYPRELSRMEMDPVEAGAGVADAALAFLESGRYPDRSIIGPRWFPGETMGGRQ